MALNQNDRERLIKLLGMIGSSADGEALNAARLAHKLISDRGMTWGQVINGNGATATPFSSFGATQHVWPQSPWHHPSAPPRPPPPPPPHRWRTVADFILNYKDDLINEWEQHFLASILDRPGALTPKQMATLVKIGTKCGVIID